MLRQVRRGRGTLDLPMVPPVDVGQDPKKGGLAGSVWTHQPHSLTEIDRKVATSENVTVAEGFFDARSGQETSRHGDARILNRPPAAAILHRFVART